MAGTKAVSTQGTKLAVNVGGVWEYFNELKTTPAFGETNERIEVTHFTSDIKEYIKGIGDIAEDVAFTMNLMPKSVAGSNTDLIEKLAKNSSYEFRVEYPQAKMMVTFTADWSSTVSAGAVNAALEWTLTLTTRSKPVISDLGSTYTVTYDSNTGTGTMTDSNSPYNAGATVTTMANTFTKTGKNFIGYNTRVDNSGVNYDEGDTFTIFENTTLYAIWSD